MKPKSAEKVRPTSKNQEKIVKELKENLHKAQKFSVRRSTCIGDSVN